MVENNKAVHTFSATENATWSLNGGADASKFNIDSSTGALTFKSAPDFENPNDSGTNNSYEVKVKATDKEGNTSDQTLTVNINDLKGLTKLFTLNGSKASISLGSSIDISKNGEFLVVGAGGSSTEKNKGFVNVYKKQFDNTWNLIDKLEQNVIGHGRSVEISDDGQIISIGGMYENQGVDYDQRYINTYKYKNGSFNNKYSERAKGYLYGGDYFGNAMSLSENGRFLIAGAFALSAETGSINVFELAENKIIKEELFMVQLILKDLVVGKNFK